MKEQRTFMISKECIDRMQGAMFTANCIEGGSQAGFERCWELFMEGINEFPNDLHYMYCMTLSKRKAEEERRRIAKI